jgi:hypothetical protein
MFNEFVLGDIFSKKLINSIIGTEDFIVKHNVLNLFLK